MPSPIYRLRNLQAVLQKMEHPVDMHSGWAWFLWLLGGGALLAAAYAHYKSGSSAWMNFVISYVVLSIGCYIMERSARKRLIGVTQWSADHQRAAVGFFDANQSDYLEVGLDTEVGSLLDDCSRLYLEAEAALAKPDWQAWEELKPARNELDHLLKRALETSAEALCTWHADPNAFATRMTDPNVRGPMMRELKIIRANFEILNLRLSQAEGPSDLAPALERPQEIRAAEEELHIR